MLCTKKLSDVSIDENGFCGRKGLLWDFILRHIWDRLFKEENECVSSDQSHTLFSLSSELGHHRPRWVFVHCQAVTRCIGPMRTIQCWFCHYERTSVKLTNFHSTKYFRKCLRNVDYFVQGSITHQAASTHFYRWWLVEYVFYIKCWSKCSLITASYSTCVRLLFSSLGWWLHTRGPRQQNVRYFSIIFVNENMEIDIFLFEFISTTIAHTDDDKGQWRLKLRS